MGGLKGRSLSWPTPELRLGARVVTHENEGAPLPPDWAGEPRFIIFFIPAPVPLALPQDWTFGFTRDEEVPWMQGAATSPVPWVQPRYIDPDKEKGGFVSIKAWRLPERLTLDTAQIGRALRAYRWMVDPDGRDRGDPLLESPEKPGVDSEATVFEAVTPLIPTHVEGEAGPCTCPGVGPGLASSQPRSRACGRSRSRPDARSQRSSRLRGSRQHASARLVRPPSAPPSGSERRLPAPAPPGDRRHARRTLRLPGIPPRNASIGGFGFKGAGLDSAPAYRMILGFAYLWDRFAAGHHPIRLYRATSADGEERTSVMYTDGKARRCCQSS